MRASAIFPAVAGVFAVLLIGIAGSRIETIVNDPAPLPGAIGGTVVIDQPAPVAATSTTASASLTQPLPGTLLTMQPTNVKVPYGQIRVPAGIPVKLVRDNGPTVDVLFNRNVVSVARTAVVTPGSENVSESPLGSVRQWIDTTLHAPASSLGLEAKETGVGAEVTPQSDAENSTSAGTLARLKEVEVEVRNLSRRPSGDCDLTVHWIARRTSDRARYIHHSDTFKVALDGSSQQTVTSTCPSLDSHVQTSAASSEKRTDAGRLEGWVVLLQREGQLLVGRGCDGTYDELLKDPTKRAALLANFSARSSGPGR